MQAARIEEQGGLSGRTRLQLEMMQLLKAHVHNGRLVLDEPSDLPDGEVVYLQPANVLVEVGDASVDEDDRARLHQALDEGITAARSGDHVDAEEFVKELLARR